MSHCHVDLFLNLDQRVNLNPVPSRTFRLKRFFYCLCCKIHKEGKWRGEKFRDSWLVCKLNLTCLVKFYQGVCNSHTRLDVHLNGYRHQVCPVVWMNSKERYRGSGVPHFSSRAKFHDIWHTWQVIQQWIPQDKYHSAGYCLCIGSNVNSD